MGNGARCVVERGAVTAIIWSPRHAAGHDMRSVTTCATDLPLPGLIPRSASDALKLQRHSSLTQLFRCLQQLWPSFTMPHCISGPPVSPCLRVGGSVGQKTCRAAPARSSVRPVGPSKNSSGTTGHVFLWRTPLVGWEGLADALGPLMPPQMAMHVGVVLHTPQDGIVMVYDFMPERPTDPQVAGTLLLGGAVPGEAAGLNLGWGGGGVVTASIGLC